MRRVIKNIEYKHEEHMSRITLEVEMQGISSTHLTVESIDTGGAPQVAFWTDSAGDGIAALATNEGISQTEALAQVAGVLADIESADRLNRRARTGLAAHVLLEMAEGRD